MPTEIKVNDRFYLDGKDYTVLESPKPELILFADLDFINRVPQKGRKVVCLKKEVIWNDGFKAWTLAGRLLSLKQKTHFGLKQVEMSWGTSLPGYAPRAEDHEEILSLIDKGDL